MNNKLRRARKVLRKCKLLSTIEENMPADLTKTQQANIVIRYAHWLGMDFCSTCDMQQDYCSCDIAIPDSQLTHLRLSKSFDEDMDSHKSLFVPHSGLQQDVNVHEAPNDPTHETVDFHDQMDSYIYDTGNFIDETRTLTDGNSHELNDFFKRPVEIYRERWTVNTRLNETINPWGVYFDNPRVINRISNYHLMKCTMKVKFLINGNGFYYGRAMAGYLPLSLQDDFSTNAAAIPEDLVQTTQYPHIYLNPTTSTGGELTLPMFWYYDSLNIVEQQYDLLGEIFVRSFTTLQNSNGATDPVTVTAFAWLEDVVLSVPTHVNPGDAPIAQSGLEDETDEANKKGFISGPATNIAKVASSLSMFPMIRPYAKATELAATSTASLAKIFGFAKPVITKVPEPMRPTITSSLAVANVPDTSQKLTFDDKNELTIDTRIAGIDAGDPLSIVGIAGREAYLTQFDWSLSNTTTDTLWNCRVSPVLWSESSGSVTAYHFPPCAVAALPFEYWTGSIKFRFQIVCSAYHKGRLRISYDPAFTGVPEYNTNCTHIVDIADETDFTVQIGCGQEKAYMDHAKPGLDSVTEAYSTTPYVSRGPGNGTISVRIVNELTAPSTAAGADFVKVNVFVSAGEDFQVMCPSSHFQRFVFKPQSGFEPQSGAPDSFNKDHQHKPLHDTTIQLGPSPQKVTHLNDVYSGETISSFRTVLKRFNNWKVIGSAVAPTVGSNILSGRSPMFPYFRGNVGDPVDTQVSTAPYNFCNTVMLHWITICFQGWRGSIRYKIIPAALAQNDCSLAVSRITMTSGQTAYAENVTLSPAPGSLDALHKNNVYQVLAGDLHTSAVPTFAQGGAMTCATVNSALEFEMPYIRNHRFTPAKVAVITDFAEFMDSFDYTIEYFAQNTKERTEFIVNVAAGEDFQPLFWTAMPRAYFEVNPPEPLP